MKLLICIVQDDDSAELINEITTKNFQVTKLATTGGFLKKGNTTLLIGIEEEKLDEVISIIKNKCKPRKEISNPISEMSAPVYIPIPLTITVGGAIVFVVDVENFIKI